jgi:hypothetical protein
VKARKEKQTGNTRKKKDGKKRKESLLLSTKNLFTRRILHCNTILSLSLLIHQRGMLCITNSMAEILPSTVPQLVKQYTVHTK